uniref:G-protein coupled receptors family 3 profile domain-containing protein n=2 Tax=Xenopus tropicalis TaxID=8364 RepID=A0A803JMD4_XENTR
MAFTSLFQYFQISYGATDPVLNDRTLYPHYLSTGPNEYIQHIAIAELVERLGWTWVIILATSNDGGQKESQNLKNEINKHGACVDLIGTLTGNNDTDKRTLERIQKSTAEVVILCGGRSYNPYFVFILKEIINNKMVVVPVTCVFIPNDFLYNGCLQFQDTNMMSDESLEVKFTEHIYAPREDELLKDLLANDHLCLTHDKEKDDLFQRVYKLLYRNCSNITSPMLYYYPSHRVSTAVSVLARAQHNLLSSSGKHSNSGLPTIIHRKQLHRYLRNVLLNEQRELDYGEAYLIHSLYKDSELKGQEIHVGEYTWSESGSSLRINTEEIVWKKDTKGQILKSQCSTNCPPGYRKVPREGAPPCCYDCAPCSEGEISNLTDMDNCLKCGDYEWPNPEKTLCIEKQLQFLSYDDSLTLVFIVLSLVFFIIAAVILGIFISFRDTPVVRANNHTLSFILLVSIKLSFLSVFLFLGHPVDITCMLRQTSFGITFSIAVSCVLAKTLMVSIAFKATKPGSPWRKWVGVKVAYCIVLSCSIIQILISVIWLTISPPFLELNFLFEPGQIIIQCNEGSAIGFYIVLSYMGLLASVSFIVAFLARSLPDSFNEAKYITFSMLLFCSVWITMIPAYLSTKGKYMVAVEIFAIISSSCGLLFCIFLPKCYIILFKPEMNSKQYLLGNNR